MDLFTAVIVVVGIVTGWIGIYAVSRLIVSYLQSRRRNPELTTSELSRIVTSAVEEAARPLAERIDRMERRLPASDDRLLLPESDSMEDDEKARADARRTATTRS